MNKKLCGGLLMIGLAVVLVGCAQNKLEDPRDRDYSTLEGSFKDLGGIKVNKTITHLFEDEEGTIYYAYSDQYNLDNLDSFGERVEVYGAVLTYEDLDNPVLEVRRISEAKEELEENIEVKMFEYKDVDLGFSIQYPDNWSFEAQGEQVRLEAPQELTESEMELDHVLVGQVEANLLKTAEDLPEDRLAEIVPLVRGLHPDLATATGTLAYVGQDSLFAVHFKLLEGESYYFVPRETELFEISHHPGANTEDKTNNAIIFSNILASFDFLSEEEEVEEGVEEDELVEEAPFNEDQLEVDEYTDFTSGPFEFSMAYPSDWYYSGGNGGYDFSDQPLEDGMTPLIRLDLNSGKTEGRSQNGGSVTLTVVVEGRTYSLTGASEYESIMRHMADSITRTPNEDQ